MIQGYGGTSPSGCNITAEVLLKRIDRSVADARWGVAIVEEPAFGYFVEIQGERLAIHSEAGGLVAYTGDRVALGGGEWGSDGAWLACGGIENLEQR